MQNPSDQDNLKSYI